MEENKKETKPVEKTEVKKEATSKVATEPKKEEAKKETPKTTNKKVDNKKANNNTIIMAVIVVVIALVAIIIAVSLGNNSPKKVVENTLRDLKAGVYAQNMLSGLIQEEDNLNTEAQKLLVEKLEWKVLSEKQEGETATVEVEIKNKNFKTIMGNYMQKALKAAISGNATQEDMTNSLMEELRNEEVEITTVTQTINLEKNNGKWEIIEDENFANAVLPGLYDAINAFN